jgi:serine/threonine-protein kinase
MVASEAAENLLLGDHAATRALVEDIARNQQIHYLAIADRYGAVVASTQPAEIGHALPAAPAGGNRVAGDAITSYQGTASSSDAMLLFDVPIRYQTKTVGALRLGVSDAPLRAAQHTTLGVIVAVLLMSLAAVVGAAYWLLWRLQIALDLLADALMRVARGDYGHRIRLQRHDELGRLFGAFNLMNGALQERPPRRSRPAGAPAAGPVPPRMLPAPTASGADRRRRD